MIDRPDDMHRPPDFTRLFSAAALGAACGLFWGISAVGAQTAATVLPRPITPPPALPAYARPEPALPPPVGAPFVAAPSGAARFVLRDVELIGVTVVPTEALRATARPYIGQAVTAADLESLRRALSEVYVRHGYINSGFTLPDQTVHDGVVRMTAIEGRLSEILPQGESRLVPAYVADRLRRRVPDPLLMTDLREALEILLQDPVIERVDARLSPGARPGESVLTAKVVDKPMVETAFTFADNRSPSQGSYEGRSEATLRNLSGYGEVTTLRFGRGRGLTDAAAAVEIPLSASDARLRLSVESLRARVVEKPFSILDIQTATTSYEIGVTQPVWRTAGQELTLGLALNRREAISRLLDEKFSFSAEADNGVNRVTALRFSQTWTDRGVSRVLAARSTFSFGLDALGSTVKAGAPDSRFIAWLGQAQAAQRLDDDGTQLIMRLEGQFADNPLPGIEQYALGGMGSVRGYRENLAARDNAVVASVEVRRPIFNLALDDSSALAADGSPVGTVQAAAFADWGRGFNSDRDTPSPGSISAVGVGALWRPTAWAQAQLYYGRALRKADTGRDTTLQDRGVHFRLTFTP